MGRSTLVALVVLTAAVAPQLHGQTLARRIASARDGVLAMTYAVRDGVCGDGRSFIGDDTGHAGGFNMYMLDGTSISSMGGMDMRGNCRSGPARVLITIRDGAVTDVRPFVGPSDRLPSRFDTDLGSVAGDEAAQALLDIARRGGERLSRNAVLGASIADGARVATPLAQMARDRSLRTELREVALRWLLPAAQREGDSRAVETVRRVAADAADDTAVRERAIRVLGEEGDGLRELRALYPTLRESSLKDRIVRLNGEQGDAESRRWLRAVAERGTEPMEARDRAIRVLAEAGDEPYLREAFDRLDDPALRERVLRSLGESGGARNLRWLREVATSSRADEALRERAVRALAEGGAQTSELVQLYDGTESPVVRQRLISLFAERGDRTAKDKLTSIARSDADPDNRRRALRKIGEMAGER